MAIEQERLRELQQSMGEDFVRELVDTFAQEAPQIVADMRDAVRSGDQERFRRAAHSLKSNAGTFGATELAEQARSLELGAVPADAAAVDALERSLHAALATLRELCHG
jgi:histidine phosphotransfer protein HptB